MPAQYNPSDDAVAEILKKDAKLSSNRYAQVGLQALLPKRYFRLASRDTGFLLILIQASRTSAQAKY